MKRYLNFISVFAIALFQVIIIVCCILGKSPKVPLSGVVINNEKPCLNIKGILNGNYQNEYDKYFGENYPLRSYFIRSYNQIQYDLKTDKDTIVLGKNDYLYSTEYIETYLKPCNESNIKEIYKYAKNVRKMQDKLEACNKMFYYVISPSKAEIYPEYIPDKYMLNYNKNYGKNNREVLIEALKKEGVHYFDTTPLMKKLKSKYSTFFKTGIHWNYYAAAIAGKQLIKRINNEYNLNLQTPKLRPYKQKTPNGAEQDLYQLYNMWSGVQDDYYYGVDKEYKSEALKNYNLFDMGVSFSIELLNSFLDNNNKNAVFNKMVRYQYLTFEDRYENDTIQTDQNISLDTVQKELNNNDIILMENNASYIPDSHKQFVNYVLGLDNRAIKSNENQIGSESGNMVIDFVANGNSNDYIQSGFYDQESDHRWASGDADIMFNYDKNDDIELNIYASQEPDVKTKIYINNKYLCNLELDAKGNSQPIVIKSKYLNKVKQHISFISDNVKSPHERGISDDIRKLAVFMRKIVISSAK